MDTEGEVLGTMPIPGTRVGNTIFRGVSSGPGNQTMEMRRVDLDGPEFVLQKDETVQAYHRRLATHLKSLPQLTRKPALADVKEIAAASPQQ